MRIKIVGDTLAGRTLKGYVEKSGYAVANYLPDFIIEFVEGGNDFIVDGVDSELESRIVFHLENFGVDKFILQRGGGVRSEMACKITYPSGWDSLVARSVIRAVQEAYTMPKRNPWWKKLLVVGSLLLLGSEVSAQQFVYGRAWDTVNIAAVDPGDSVNQALRINCVAGCVAGGSFADSSAFSFGTSPVGLTAFVVDDVGTNTVAENSAGAARMNTNRIPYFDLSKSLANTNAFLVTGTGGTFPVTGTFWQGTQPVSGTFWQTTQPVSWSAQTVTVTQGTGTNLHAVIDTGSTTAVTQATGTNLHAVVDSGSITATQATGTNLHTVIDSGTITTVSTVTAVTGITNALPAGTNRIGSVRLVDSADADLTSAKGTQTSRFVGVQNSNDSGRLSRMFTASVASTATAETLITLTFSNGLAATSTCSSCAVTSGKKLQITSLWISARNSTGTTASNVVVNLRAAVGGATSASSPLQMHFQAPLPASTVAILFPAAIIPEAFEIDANSGTNTFGMTITHPQWVTGSVVATFDISIAAYEY